MIFAIAFAVALAPTAQAVQQRLDTTFAMPSVGRLDITNARGTVAIQRWDRPEVRIQADHRSSDTIQVQRSRSLVTVVASSHRGAARFSAGSDTSRVVIRTTGPAPTQPTLIDYTVTVPAGFAVDVSGNAIDVLADGLNGPVNIATVSGRIHVVNFSGAMHLQTLIGRIRVERGGGRLFARAMRGSLTVRQFSGEVDVMTSTGEMDLAGVTGDQVRATSVSGAITVAGPVSPNGRYSISTQSGTVRLTFGPTTNATIDIAARKTPMICDGIAETTPPSRSWRRFLLGEGTALVEVDSFDGAVHLCRENGGSE